MTKVNKIAIIIIAFLVLSNIAVIYLCILNNDREQLIAIRENYNYTGELIWNMRGTTNIEILNNGTIIDSYQEKIRLGVISTIRIRLLVNELRWKILKIEEGRNEYEFTIDGKTYPISSLDSRGQKIIKQIEKIANKRIEKWEEQKYELFN